MEEKKQDKIPIVMSPAFLKPEEEKEHYGLYRYVIVKRKDEFGIEKPEQVEPALGPLMVFRIARKDERVDMRTIDPDTMQEIKLHKVWDPREN